MSDLTIPMIKQHLVDARKEMREKMFSLDKHDKFFRGWDEAECEVYGEQLKPWNAKVYSKGNNQ